MWDRRQRDLLSTRTPSGQLLIKVADLVAVKGIPAGSSTSTRLRGPAMVPAGGLWANRSTLPRTYEAKADTCKLEVAQNKCLRVVSSNGAYRARVGTMPTMSIGGYGSPKRPPAPNNWLDTSRDPSTRPSEKVIERAWPRSEALGRALSLRQRNGRKTGANVPKRQQKGREKPRQIPR